MGANKGSQKVRFKFRLKEKSGIKHRIVTITTIVLIAMAVIISTVMAGSLKSLTSTMLLETLEPMAKMASQAVESNLHLLGDRILTAAENKTLRDSKSSAQSKKAILKRMESGIEFVWIGFYGTDGSYIDGVNKCPSSLAGEEMFALMTQTQNLVIDDTKARDQNLEVAIGAPVLDDTGKPLYYLVGSYKYDVINDVLSNINISTSGKALIINDHGQIVAAQDQKFINSQKSLTDYFSSNDENESTLSKKMINGEIGSMHLKSNGDKLVVSYAPVRGTHWSIAVYANEKDFMSIVNKSRFVVLLVALVILILATLAVSRFSGTICRPLTKVTRRIENLALGDLESDVEVLHTKDETETLSAALQKTVRSINLYIKDLDKVLNELAKGNLAVRTETEFHGDFSSMKNSLDHISNALNEIMHEIQTSIGLLLETSRMVADNSHLVDEASDEQVHCVEQLSEGADMISSSIMEVSDNTEKARDLMGETEQRLTEGDELMTGLLSSMDQITKNFDQITKINKFLEDIAFQTNILAINAAVEAARAGEAGKGFSVVAEEVRALAAKSTESAQSASQIVGNSRSAVENGSDLARKTAASMTEISDISKQIADITMKLSDSVEDEKAALEKMLHEVDSISQLAGKNTQVSAQNSHASSQLNQQAEHLKALAEKFRLKE